MPRRLFDQPKFGSLILRHQRANGAQRTTQNILPHLRISVATLFSSLMSLVEWERIERKQAQVGFYASYLSDCLSVASSGTDSGEEGECASERESGRGQ